MTDYLQYGSGLRLMENVRLRIKDIDVDRRATFVRGGEGAKDSVVTLPEEQTTFLLRHIESSKTCYQRDRGN